MKIAVCVEGILREFDKENDYEFPDFIGNNLRLKKAFPNANFFYSTWDYHRNTFEKYFPDYNFFTFTQPKNTYHSIFDVPAFTERMKLMQDRLLHEDKSVIERIGIQYYQILQHAMIVEKLREVDNFDVVIRARYDSYVSPHANFMPYITESYKEDTVFGFAHIGGDFHKTKDITKNKNFHMMLLDQLIIHRNDALNTNLVYDLYNKKQLAGCEFGWYQIFSNKNHKCISGWIDMERTVKKRNII